MKYRALSFRAGSVRQVALNLGISNQNLGIWLRQFEAADSEPLAAAERQELVELRRRVRTLEAERDILKEGSGLLRPGGRPDPVTVFRFVKREKAAYPVTTLCRVLGVSPSGYRAWRGRPRSPRAAADEALTERIRTIHRASRGNLRRAEGAGRAGRRGHRLWPQAGGSSDAPRRLGRRPPAPQPAHDPPRSWRHRPPDLVERAFAASGPDRLWVADITYLPTWSGFLYLAVVVDAWSRYVVGWSMATHMRTELVTDAPRHGPRAPTAHGRSGPPLRPRLQYTSLAYGRLPRDGGCGTREFRIGQNRCNTLDTAPCGDHSVGSPAAAAKRRRPPL